MSLFPNYETQWSSSLAEESTSDFLESIITSQKVPLVILRRIGTMLVFHVVSQERESPDDLTARRLLTIMQQRHPAVIEKVVEEADSQGDDVTQAVEELVVSLSVVSIPQFSSGV